MGSSKKGFGPSYATGTSATEILGAGGLMAKNRNTQTSADAQRQYELGRAVGATRINQANGNAGLARRFAGASVNDAASQGNVAAAILRSAQEGKQYDMALQDLGTQQGIGRNEDKKQASIMGAAGNVVSSGVKMFSDETIKKDVLDITDFTKQTLGALTPYQFQYSEDVGMKGNVIGVMAQDLEKSATGRTLVMDHEGKKAIDVTRAVSFILASLADLNKRLEKAGV